MYITVTKYAKDFTLIDTPDGQKPIKNSLAQIFNDMEADGYKMVSSAGSAWELVFVFHKDGPPSSDAHETEEGKKKKEKKEKH